MSDDFLDKKWSEAVAYHDMKRYEQAELDLKEILAINPEHISAKYLLASSYYMLDRYSEAETICTDILTTYLAVNSYRLLGNIYRDTKRFKKSEEFYLKSLELDPNNASALAEYSYLLLICGYKKKANEVMSDALELEPDNSIVLHYKYYFDFAHGRKKEENKSIEQYFTYSSNEVQKLVMLGLSDYKRNRFKSSKEYFRQAFLLEPTNKYILEMLDTLDEVNHFIFFPNRLFSKMNPVLRLVLMPLVVILTLIGVAVFSSQLAAVFIIVFYVCIVLLVIWSWLSRPIYNFFIKSK